MITTATTAEALSAIGQAHRIVLSAYLLRQGQLLDAVEAAARRGAAVTVRLERRPYGGNDSAVQAQLSAQNQAAAAAILAAGGDAQVVQRSDADGKPLPLHMKALVCDGVAYLDDRNFPGDGEDTIVRDDFPRDVAAVTAAIEGKRAAQTSRFFWTEKDRALSGETRLLYEAQNAKHVDVESESFGYDGAYAGLKMLAAKGVQCRLLVSERDLTTPQAKAALQKLKEDGVRVRIGDFDEKMSVVDGTRAWVGSANATRGFPQETDWGLRTDRPDVVQTLESHFNAYWNAAKPV